MSIALIKSRTLFYYCRGRSERIKKTEETKKRVYSTYAIRRELYRGKYVEPMRLGFAR
jgi:hypothetical protein